jgi:hypothetical protein
MSSQPASTSIIRGIQTKRGGWNSPRRKPMAIVIIFTILLSALISTAPVLVDSIDANAAGILLD